MQKEVVLQRAGIIIFQVCVCNALLSLSLLSCFPVFRSLNMMNPHTKCMMPACLAPPNPALNWSA